MIGSYIILLCFYTKNITNRKRAHNIIIAYIVIVYYNIITIVELLGTQNQYRL